MATTSIFAAKGSLEFHWKAGQRSETLYSKQHNIKSFPLLTVLQPRDSNRNRNVVVYCSAKPDKPLPSKSNFAVWKRWSVGIFLSVILPFSANKWGSLLKIKNEADTKLQRVEDVVETVEKMAERVEKLTEDLVDDIPDGVLLKRVMSAVEKFAEKIAKTANSVDDVIDKVQEMGEKVESYLEMKEELERKEDAVEEKTRNIAKEEKIRNRELEVQEIEEKIESYLEMKEELERMEDAIEETIRNRATGQLKSRGKDEK